MHGERNAYMKTELNT